MPHGKSASLTVATYNIHKGFRASTAALWCTICGAPDDGGPTSSSCRRLSAWPWHVERHEAWPDAPQHEFLAETQWPAAAYAGNAVYEDGHHGNAICRVSPMIRCDHGDISQSFRAARAAARWRSRLCGCSEPAPCLCVSGLFGAPGVQQEAVCARINIAIPAMPLILAGDFKRDRRHRAGDPPGNRFNTKHLRRPAGVRPQFSGAPAHPATDRMAAWFHVQSAQVHRGRDWSWLSDSAPLAANLVLA